MVRSVRRKMTLLKNLETLMMYPCEECVVVCLDWERPAGTLISFHDRLVMVLQLDTPNNILTDLVVFPFLSLSYLINI